MLSVVAPQRTYAALPVALLGAFAYAQERSPLVRRHAVAAVLLDAGAAGLSVALTGGPESPMLPYLLAPGLCVALLGSRWQLLRTSATSVVGLVVGRLLLGALTDVDWSSGELALAAGQWVLLGLGLGLVTSWARAIEPEDAPSGGERYAEARALLSQLRDVSHRLPGGLDVGTAADALLERAAEVVASQRSAVLVQQVAGGALSPAAVRGTRRVPWRTPLDEPGPLKRAWDGLEPVVESRAPDTRGRRHGGTLVALPLRTPTHPFGLLVLEALEPDAFSPEVVAQLHDLVVEGALRLETALLFQDVRDTVLVEERERLAREMHDGVAQELAFVGYQLDDLRNQAAKVDEDLSAAITDVRRGLTRLVSDIRLSITDLKTSVSQDRGLGAAVSAYVRSVGSGQKVTVHLSLQEGSLRLPGEQEVALFRVVQAVVQDVRRAEGADNLWVDLDVDAPSARLHVEHDRPDSTPHEDDYLEQAHQMARFGGTLRAGPGRQGDGVSVDVVLGGDTGGSHGPARR